MELYVYYRHYLVGTLTLINDEWRFSYSQEFKNLKTIPGLIEFPDKEKEYVSKTLFSLFEDRIPSKCRRGAETNYEIFEKLALFKSVIHQPFTLELNKLEPATKDLLEILEKNTPKEKP